MKSIFLQSKGQSVSSEGTNSKKLKKNEAVNVDPTTSINLSVIPKSETKSPKKKSTFFEKMIHGQESDAEAKSKSQFSMAKKKVSDENPSKKRKSLSYDPIIAVDQTPNKNRRSGSKEINHSPKRSDILDTVKHDTDYSLKSPKGKKKASIFLSLDKTDSDECTESLKMRAFRFMDGDKKAFNNKSKSKGRERSPKPKKCKPSIQQSSSSEGSAYKSSIFQFEDDPYVMEIMSRKKKETDKLAARSKSKSQGKKRQSLTKMVEFSQTLTNNINQRESDKINSKFKIPKVKKSKKKESKSSPKKIDSFYSNRAFENEVEDTCDYMPSIDELLKLPDWPEDGGKTVDEVLDDLDVEIKERKRQHEEEMAKLDADISAEKARQQERRERMKRNAVLRDKFANEVTESVLRRMFSDNLMYLKNIEGGVEESSRHKAFHKSSRTRHALYYTMITEPFTDEQLEWTLDEISKVWMRNKREQMDNNEYVWKVLLAECFIKFYMDHFGLNKQEAEKRIGETPLRKVGTESDDESCDI